MSRLEELMALADAYAYAGNIDPDASRAALERALRDALEPPQGRIRELLEESLRTHEMWADVAPAVSLCADIRKALAAAPKEPTK